MSKKIWTLQEAKDDYSINSIPKKKKKVKRNCENCSFSKKWNDYVNLSIFYSCEVKKKYIVSPYLIAKLCKYFTPKNNL